MKKTITLLFLSCLFAATLFAQPQKVVLIEEGTGTWCQWCPRGDIYAQELQKNYPGQFVFVAVHEGDPMEVPEYWNAVGLINLPTGQVDRSFISFLDPFSELFSDMDQQLALTPPAGISVETTWEASTREMTMTVTGEFAEALNGDYRLAAIVVEDGVTGSAPFYDQSNSYSGGDFGPMGGYEDLPSPVSASIMVFNHVGRHLPGGFNGEVGSLPNSIAAGETHSYTYTYTLPDEYEEEYVHVVGLLVNAANGQVLNAGRSNYLPGYANAKPFFHSNPQEQGYIDLNYQYDIVTHDPEHDELTITAISNLPNGLSLNDLGDGFAELIGVPTQLGTFEITLNVNDGEWDVEQTFQLSIGEPNAAWLQVGATGFSSTDPSSLDIEISSTGMPYVMSSSFSENKAFIYKYENDEWQLLGPPLPANGFHSSMALGPDDAPYLFTNGLVFKYQNNSWAQVGSNLPGSDFIYTKIVVADDGTPYTVHFAPPSSTVSYRYTGTEWESLGAVTDGVGVWNRFNLDNNGQPILIYGTDGQNIAYSEVAQWDGSNWNHLGNDYIEPTSQTYFDHDVAVAPNGDVFAALTIGVGEQKLNIYQLVNDTWEMIAENLAGGATESCNLETDANGNLIVGFRDESQGGRTSVMKYDGNEWTYMGLPGFTSIASSQSLALDPNGIPYVAYRDANEEDRVSVKKFADLSSSIFELPIADYRLNVFPNPNSDQFTLVYEKGQAFELVNVSGQVMMSGALNPDFQQAGLLYQNMDVQNVPQGVYFLKVVGEEGIQTVKVMKE